MTHKLRSTRITLSASFAALIASITGCADADPDTSQVCKEEISDMRVDDGRCEDDDDDSVNWYYIPRIHGYPGVGEKVNINTGTYARPAGGSISTVRPAGLGGSSYAGDSSGS